MLPCVLSRDPKNRVVTLKSWGDMIYITFKYIKLHEVFMDMYVSTGISKTKIIKMWPEGIHRNLEKAVVFRGKMIKM